MISIDEMEVLLDEISQELPEEFFKELNGGILLLPQKKMHEKSVDNDLYVLGEYHRDRNLGRYIAIYYGSFIKVHKSLSKEQLKEKLRHTIKHEFRHHLESLAGERGLEIEDKKNINDYLNRKNKK
jgi:predicted Zn-dependent protease with MMP-like domain